jgi:hypothetical protein
VRAEPGIDEIRALRAWLKIGLRTFGLRCLKIEQDKRRMTMDMRKYSAGVIMPENLCDGPRVEKIINIFEHEKHECAVLEFENGDQLYLWPNLARVLNKAWGYDSDNWLKQEVELSRGHYLDKKTDPPTEKECINIRAISPVKQGANSGAPVSALSKVASRSVGKHDDMDDEIPF